MILDIRPIVSALLRNRTGAALVAVQIAITLAVLVNALFIVEQRIQKIGRPTGIDVDNIFAISSAGFTSHFNYDASLREDLAYLRSVPGVIAASPTESVPLSGSGSSEELLTRPDQRPSDGTLANYFEMDEQGIKTLGVHLAAGRNFRADEIQPPIRRDNSGSDEGVPPEVIITQDLAQELFPNQNALGKTVYDALKKPATIIGIIDHMHGSWANFGPPGEVAIFPRLPMLFGFYYLVRTQPGQRDAVMRRVEEHMESSNPNRVIKWVRPLSMFKQHLYESDRNMGIFLTTTTLLLLAVTSLGIFGLGTFNVSTRTKQIGTRRAIGARRIDIIRYFMVENGLITTAGIVAGCGLALAVGFWLTAQYSLPRLDLYYLVGGVLALWTLGQIAVWQPARRASRVSPSVATRTV
jgi:putative ABC transport system permease protein